MKFVLFRSLTFILRLNKIRNADDGCETVYVMVRNKRDIPVNGQGSGFDNEADFIPFELSDVEEQVDDARPDSRASYTKAESVAASQRGYPVLTNGEGRKRKRSQIENSPDRGPPPKHARTSLNPWQTDVNDYASLKETAKMY